MLLNFVPGNRIEAKKLAAIAAAHGRRSITAAELEEFCAAWVDTLRDVGGEAPAVLAAWEAVLQPGLDLLRRGMVREGSA